MLHEFHEHYNKKQLFFGHNKNQSTSTYLHTYFTFASQLSVFVAQIYI